MVLKDSLSLRAKAIFSICVYNSTILYMCGVYIEYSTYRSFSLPYCPHLGCAEAADPSVGGAALQSDVLWSSWGGSSHFISQ